MDLQQRTRRFGIYVILCACILRLTLSGGMETMIRHLTEQTPFLTSLETGRNVRFSASVEKCSDHSRESPAPWQRVPEKPTFSVAEADALEMDYDCSRRPDLAALLSQPLDWDLTGEAPTVLIFHTHTTESYTKAGEDYAETSRYRTLDSQYNMLSIGETVANLLQQAGIGVIHDRTVHDHPSYNGSYAHARQTVQEILTENPSIRLVLDLHRDATEIPGEQLRTEALVAGESSAQLMFVVGTDVSYPSHANWEENLSLALKLQTLLSRAHPGLMRPLNLRSQRFNQDLSPGALLVEVGAAGNTHGEALTAARALAEAVIRLSMGGKSDS